MNCPMSAGYHKLSPFGDPSKRTSGLFFNSKFFVINALGVFIREVALWPTTQSARKIIC